MNGKKSICKVMCIWYRKMPMQKIKKDYKGYKHIHWFDGLFFSRNIEEFKNKVEKIIT